MVLKKMLLFILTLSLMKLSAQESPAYELLYSKDIPFSKVAPSDLDEFGLPRIYPFPLADVESGDVVFLVIPGGGYARVAIGHEGIDVAKRLNDANYSAYVLYYRIPKDEVMVNKKYVPLQDAVRAVEIVRERHPDKKIAVVGFSAGGHLAATLSNFPKNAELAVKGETFPSVDYSVLAYPVISMEDSVTHKGSKQNLIGLNASVEDTEAFSLDKQVSRHTPPTFIMHAKDDKGVPIENSYRYIRALQQVGVPFESYIYGQGGHGFGLKNRSESGDWFAKMLEWIKD